MEKHEDRLEHKQEDNDTIAKAENPDRDFMDSEGLCPKCHGKCESCKCED